MKTETAISSLVKKIEHMISARPALGEKYGKIFYSDMVDREIEMADLSSEDRIAHLGCGAFPFTAFELARRGWELSAVDCDEKALNKAEKLSQQYEFANKIDFIHGLCQEIDYSSFDVIWISYNVRPGKECLFRAVETMGSSGKIIYRQPRGWLKNFDGRIDAVNLFSNNGSDSPGENGRLNEEAVRKFSRVEQKVGKESVLIEIKPESGCEHQDNLEEKDNILSLEDLPAPSSCRVSFVPDNTLLPPLGVRQGKKLNLKTREKFSGPLIVEVDNRQVAVPRELASNIKVKFDV